MKPIVAVRAVRNWKGEPGYGWACAVHPLSKGIHLFNRWTDRIRRTPDRHPWERAMCAAQRHIHNHHPDLRRCGPRGTT